MDETWDLGTLSLPERSRLYHLKPVGIDTPLVENLTSYIIRLAEAHCVLPKTLITKEVLPLLTETGGPEGPALFSYGAVLLNAQALNGMGSMAASGVNALEKLTRRKDLRLLTMLPWANVISKYGIFRQTQAWCPLCFEQWRVNTDVIYTPLLWSLKAVRACPHHKRLLDERCPSPQCNKTIPILNHCIRSGYCPHCNCWLGKTADAGETSTETAIHGGFEQEVWNVTAIGELLEGAPRLSSSLQKEDLALAIDFLIDRLPVKKAASLTRLLDRKSVQTVALWQKGLDIPRMKTLLQMCQLLDISPRQLFYRESDGVLLTISEEHKKFNREMDPVDTGTPRDPEELRRALETVLDSDEEPFPSIIEVARRLGYSNKSSLYKRFPELASAITAKHQKYRKSHPAQKMKSDELWQALESILSGDEDPPPSLREVAQRLGYRGVSPLYARCPELARAIAARKRKHNPGQRESMSSDELREALECALASSEEPPPSIHEVAQRLGYRHAGPLRSRFPELCRAITKKHQSHNPSDRKRMSSLELRRALEGVLASNEDPPPSLQEVAHRLGYRSVKTLYDRSSELARAITAKYQGQHPVGRAPMEADEMRQALEAILASNEEPPPSIREVALRVGYRSESSLYRRFPELTHKLVAKHRKYTSHYKERTGASELQQALEAVLASQEEPFPSIQEVARRLGYRSERTLYKRFPDLSRAIAERYQKYKFNRQENMNLEELRRALETMLASQEEPFPSMNEVAQRLGYRSPAFLYKHFPELSRAITMKKRGSENLAQQLEILLKDAAPTMTQQEIARRLGCSINKLHHHFPTLSSILEQRFMQSFDFEALQAALEKELAPENEARPLSAVARSLGYPVRTLTRFFPALCQKIIVRGRLHRKRHNELRKQRIQEEVQRVVCAIDAEQRYPSLDQMLKRMDRSCVNPPIYYLEAYVPWRKALESLGY